MKARFALAAAVLLVSVLPAAAQTVDQWIVRARARVGSESTLQGLTSIHYIGTLETEGAARAIDIIFQKPLQQRITLTDTSVTEVLALDDYDAWQKRINPKNPSQWQVKLLDAAQTKRMRVQAWDNLNFLRGVEKMRGTVRLDGDASVDGHDCVKLVFTYYDSIVLTRYYDKATTKLILTTTETGTEIREEGEIIVNGLRFPRKLTNREKDGKTITITFDRVELNEVFPAGDFAVPALQPN